MSDVIRKQRDVLFEACKQIATNKRCPDWIAGALKSAVLEARKLEQEDFPELSTEIKPTSPIQVGDYVTANLYGSECKYYVSIESDTVEGVRLFHLQYVEGNNKGRNISYNVPETMLKKCGG